MTANPVELPGRVLGAFRQRVHNTENFTIVIEVASIAEWSANRTALFEALEKDAKRSELRQKWRSHLVPQSCDWSFHQRWP